MTKTLVIVLKEDTPSKFTFTNFKKNVTDELSADLCLCMEDTQECSNNDPYYNLAKFKFVFTKPKNLEEAFDYVHNVISKDKPKYEKYENINALRPMIAHPKQEENGIFYYPDVNEDNINLNDYDVDEIVIHTKDIPDDGWKGITYGIKKSHHNNLNPHNHVITYKKSLHWRDFLNVEESIFEGVRENYNCYPDLGPDSTGIVLFLRWFILKNLKDNDLINNYDRFIITKSNFMYELPHPKLEIMDERCIWIPDVDHYYGYPDRHVVLSKLNIEAYLNILNSLVLKSNEFFMKMISFNRWDLEQMINIHIQMNPIIKNINSFPHIMHSVKNNNESMDVEFEDEYEISNKIRKEYEVTKLSIDEFYNHNLNNSNKNERKDITYLTIKGRDDGFGSQYLAIMSGIAACAHEGYYYHHTPINVIEHNIYKEDLNEFIGIKNSSKKIPINMHTILQYDEANYSPNPSIYYTQKVLKTIRNHYFKTPKPKIKYLDIALHIRRGDVNGSAGDRFTTFDTIIEYLPLIKKKYPSYKVTVVSEGHREDFEPLETYCDDFLLNGEIRTSYHSLVTAKVLIMAKSGFSYTSGILSENIVYYEDFWHHSLDHWHSIKDLVAESKKLKEEQNLQ